MKSVTEKVADFYFFTQMGLAAEIDFKTFEATFYAQFIRQKVHCPYGVSGIVDVSVVIEVGIADDMTPLPAQHGICGYD